MKEKWKTLIYQNISYDNYELSNFGEIRNKTTNRILKRYTQEDNCKNNRIAYFYSEIGLGKRGCKKRISLHRAVAETYIKNPDNLSYVIAKDGDYKNISINNLYWSQYRKGDENHHKKKLQKKSNNSENVTKRRKKLKEMSVEYKGGKCIVCGYNKCIAALEFHHLDPNEKDFSIAARGVTKSWDKLKVELDKCICVCANCHREIHNGYILLEDYNIA